LAQESWGKPSILASLGVHETEAGSHRRARRLPPGCGVLRVPLVSCVFEPRLMTVTNSA
jgi:hypothetical protein